ncbi:MAG: hypothetical protein KGL04_01480 [Elusimicrobia bacterium]|nr:hypothetical protein [Elusimicrobiota bacterium]MDE2312831.1 hypothetical protein [Elusimicrobiota bacterium]
MATEISAKKYALIFCACLLAAGSAFAAGDPFQTALQSASLKAKSAFLSGRPVYGAVGSNPLAPLVRALNGNDGGEQSAARRQELAAFSAALQNVNKVQTMAAGAGKNPREMQSLISILSAQWRMTPSQTERCRELYLGGPGASKNPSSRSQAPGAAPAVSAAQAQAAARQRAAMRKNGGFALASAQGQIAGWSSRQAQGLPGPAAAVTAERPGRGQPPRAVLPEGGPQTLRVPAVPSPEESSRARDANDLRAAEQSYRENGGTVSKSLAYWRARENPDIRPGESALGYTARITTAKIMAGALSLSGLPQFEKAVSQYGYLSATDASAGAKAKAATAAAGRAAVTFVSLGGADGALGPAFRAAGKLISKLPALARVAKASPEAAELLYGDASALDHEEFASVVGRDAGVQASLERIKNLPVSIEQKQALVRRLVETKINPAYEGADELVGRQADRLMREIPEASLGETAGLPQQAEAQIMEGRLAQARPGAAEQGGKAIYRSSKANSLKSLDNSLHAQAAREGEEGTDYIATRGRQATARQTGPFCAEHALCNLFDSHIQNREIDKVADIESKILELRPTFRETGGLSRRQIYSVAGDLAQKVGKTAVKIEPENMVSFMKETGEPVLVTVRSSENGGHAMLVGNPFRAENGKIIFETFDSNNPTGTVGYISAYDLGRIITSAIAIK